MKVPLIATLLATLGALAAVLHRRNARAAAEAELWAAATDPLPRR
ncbi:DLW-39 family protein [Auraticoccus monumenti]|uniref:Uncharacterized protein n=1 Tax=Auraticoccus monumenti TaxID=675864 RepID=A0A1G6UA58_9ACTN|nr:DLW-39 family protein [Auraticoccus monumenti]SDD38169.1 hypothetical protein SAMN04489747_0832 [Auraticoccus monumenti]